MDHRRKCKCCSDERRSRSGTSAHRKDGSVTVAADSSDCPRMETEQNALRAKGMLIPWYESFEAHLKDYIGDRTFASDTGIAGTDNVQSELINVRMQLSEKRTEALPEDRAGMCRNRRRCSHECKTWTDRARKLQIRSEQDASQRESVRLCIGGK